MTPLAVLVAAMLLFAQAAIACDTCGCQDEANMDTSMKLTGAMPDIKPVDTSGMPAGLMRIPDGYLLVEAKSFDVAYLEGKMSDDISALFEKMFATAMEQSIIFADSEIGSLYYGGFDKEPTTETPYLAGVTIASDVEVAEPLVKATVPGGYYVMVEHWGDYANLGETYGKLFGWVYGNGVKLGDGPSFEHYVTDPGSTPVEEWLTEIYLPLAHAPVHGE